MLIRYLFIASFVVCLQGLVYGSWDTISPGEVKELFKEAGDFFKTESSYQVSYSIASFRGHDQQAPFEESVGSIIRKGNLVNISILDTRTIQDSKIRISIDENKRVLALHDADLDFFNPAEAGNVSELQGVKYLLKRHKDSKLVRVLINSEKIDVIEVELDGEFISRITTYYAQTHDWVGEGGATNSGKPKLELRYKLISKGVKDYDMMGVADVIDLDKKGAAKPVKKYAKYELVDLRALSK